MGTQFYRNDGMLGRMRERRVPELLHDDAKWREYPDMFGEAVPIDRGQATEMLPKGKPASHLEAPGEDDAPAKAPVRP